MSLIYPYRSHALRNDYPADEEDLPKFSVDSFSRHLSPLKSHLSTLPSFSKYFLSFWPGRSSAALSFESRGAADLGLTLAWRRGDLCSSLSFSKAACARVLVGASPGPGVAEGGRPSADAGPSWTPSLRSQPRVKSSHEWMRYSRPKNSAVSPSIGNWNFQITPLLTPILDKIDGAK